MSPSTGPMSTFLFKGASGTHESAVGPYVHSVLSSQQPAASTLRLPVVLLLALFTILPPSHFLATMPSVAEPVRQPAIDESLAKTRLRQPLKLSGALDLPFNDLTPAIGREFPEIQVVDLLEAPNSDDVIRDLAATGISSVLSISPATG